MWPVSELFESFIKRRDSEILVKADVATEEYTMREIVDFAIESKLISGEEFEIGTVVISQLVIKMRLKGDIPINARIIPYVAFDATAMAWQQADFAWQEANIPWVGGASEWMPLGEYYIDSRTKDNDIWRFVCLDKLLWSTQAYESSLTYPASMEDVWDEICDVLGYDYDDTVVIDPSYMIQSKPIGYTYRQVMGWIAGANSASVRAGKDGLIQFKRYVSYSMPDVELTATDYIDAKQTNPLKTYTRFVVQYDDEQELTYEAGPGGEDATLYMDNPFMTQGMVDDLAATLGGYSYQPVDMDARGYPHIDVGDEMGYEVYEGSTWDATTTPWQDTHIPWDGLVRYRSVILVLKMRYAGGFGMALDAPSKSESQSEYVVEGALTQQVKQINREAVKLERNYYGVTTSREEGLVVNTESGGGKAVLNADELSFWVGSTRALWFDIPNLKFKFSGTLEGVDGTFSGTVSAANIIGSTMTGGTIQTDVPGNYPRIELSSSSSLLTAEGTASRFVQLNSLPNIMGAPDLRFSWDGSATQLMQIDTSFYINNMVNGVIGLDAGTINLLGTVNSGTLNLPSSVDSVGGQSMTLSSASNISELVSDFNQLIVALTIMRIING